MKYLKNGTGNILLIFSVPHGGYLEPREFINKKEGCFIQDKNLISTFKSIKKELNNLGFEPYYIYSKIKRKKVDLNRDKKEIIGFKNNIKFWDEYHNILKKYINEADKRFSSGLYIDLHGQSTRNYLEIGYGTKKILDKYISKDSLGSILEKNGINCFPSYKNNKLLGRYRNGGFCTQNYKKNNIESAQIEIDKKWRQNIDNRKLFAKKFAESLLDYLNIK